MGHREKIFINGQAAPSVTQVLGIVDKPFLRYWYGKHGSQKCAQILKSSQEIGQTLHGAIESYFKGESLPDMDENTGRMFSLFQGWAATSGIVPTEIELDMMSQVHGFHGTCDLIGTLDGQPIIVDWKTSSAMDPLHGVQLSAYAAMYEEMTGTHIERGMIVRIDKKPEAKKAFEVKMYDALPQLFDVFKHCLALHNFVNGKGA